jgi:hypothetical protein
MNQYSLKETTYMDGTVSGTCPLASFGINGVEPSGSGTKLLIGSSLRGAMISFLEWPQRVARVLSQANSCTLALFDISNLSLHELQTKWFLRSQAAEEAVRVRGILLAEK